ncbi:MAG: HipA family kinase [Pyrinomonadaceae bacterium]
MPAIRTVNVTRYVTPLREGGSLPAIVEADDDGMYVLKFRGAGQGPKALIAEFICGELARHLGFRVPEIVFAELDVELSRTEPDPEIQDLLKASAGLNLGLDYLPGSITFDPVVDKVDSNLASRIVWFDAYITNVDRTARNSNMLMWHKELWLIDHGAALYFQHSWDYWEEQSVKPFSQIRDHVLLPFASELEKAGRKLTEELSGNALSEIVAVVPDSWLETEGSPIDERRRIYVEYLKRRLAHSDIFLEEAERARETLV